MMMLRTYWAAAGGQRGRALQFVALVVVSTLLEGLALATIIPLLSTGRTRYDVLGVVLQDGALRVSALVCFAVVGLLSAAVKFLSERLALRLIAQLEQELRQDITHALLNMRWSSFLGLRIGDINTATLLAANQVTLGTLYFFRSVGSALAAVVLAGVSLAIAPELGGFTIAFGALTSGCYYLSSQRAERHARELTQHADGLGNAVSEVFTNLKFFRSTGHVARSEERTGDLYRRYAEAWFRSQRYGPFMRFAFEGVGVLLVGIVLGAVLLTRGQFSPSSIVFVAVFYRVVPRVMLAQEWRQLARIQRPWYQAWRQRIDQASANRASPTAGRSPTFHICLESMDVMFTYPESERPALRSVSWSLDQGKCIAFVGESGCGKTTMLDIVTGLLRPTAGTVTIDGQSLSGIDLESWQSRIGLVMQSTPLFHGSVLENVKWSEEVCDRTRIEHCLELAGAADFVATLPAGIDSLIGEAGARLSGGQRQRLAIARALYREPSLLVLDEPTSALDWESEAAIIETLASLRGECAILLAAHRLRTVRIADEILVLAAGEVVERGSWDELSRSDTGRFAAAVTKQ